MPNSWYMCVYKTATTNQMSFTFCCYKMTTVNSVLSFLFLPLIITVSIASAADDEIHVSIAQGHFIGSRLTVSGRTVSRFLGIPYAKPPVGVLRFARPQPVNNTLESGDQQQMFPAVKWPPLCLQDTAGIPWAKNGAEMLKTGQMSEDCLYLNVWSPVELQGNGVWSMPSTKPVLVWIHGGGLIFGTSSFDLYDGEMLAAKADAVVVTFNYRLAALGNFYSDEVAEVKGNQGFWDQNAVLRWVQLNIAAFGGRADQVTVMGESAGGWSVSAHILSPVSRGLFQRAILQSGVLTDFPGIAEEPADYVRPVLTGVRKLGCAAENDTGISAAAVDCLRALSEKSISQLWGSLVKAPFESVVAVVDGVFFPEALQKMLTTGSSHYYQKWNFSLLVSTVEDEGSFIYEMFRRKDADDADDDHFSLQEAQTFFPQLLLNRVLKPKAEQNQSSLEALGSAINRVYLGGLTAGIRQPDEWRRRLGVAFGHLAITCPTINFARELFRGAPDSVRVNQWYFNSKLGNQKFFCQPWSGACHTSDLYSVFGMPFRHSEEFVSREREISAEVINFIRSFIRDGSPGDQQPEWLPYFLLDSEEGKATTVVAPYYEINNDYKKPANFKFNLKAFECDNIWKQFYRR